MADERPRINVPPLCRTHQTLLVQQAGYAPADPWRALLIMATLALFQGASCDPAFHARVGDDMSRIDDIGCLACFKPDLFGEVVEAAKSRDTGAIKRLGESWIEAGRTKSRDA